MVKPKDSEEQARLERYNDELNILLGYQDKPVDFKPLGEHVLIDLIMRELKMRRTEPSQISITLESKNVAFTQELHKVLNSLAQVNAERAEFRKLQNQEYLQDQMRIKGRPATPEEIQKLEDDDGGK